MLTILKRTDGQFIGIGSKADLDSHLLARIKSPADEDFYYDPEENRIDDHTTGETVWVFHALTLAFATLPPGVGVIINGETWRRETVRWRIQYDYDSARHFPWVEFDAPAGASQKELVRLAFIAYEKAHPGAAGPNSPYRIERVGASVGFVHQTGPNLTARFGYGESPSTSGFSEYTVTFRVLPGATDDDMWEAGKKAYKEHNKRVLTGPNVPSRGFPYYVNRPDGTRFSRKV